MNSSCVIYGNLKIEYHNKYLNNSIIKMVISTNKTTKIYKIYHVIYKNDDTLEITRVNSFGDVPENEEILKAYYHIYKEMLKIISKNNSDLGSDDITFAMMSNDTDKIVLVENKEAL